MSDRELLELAAKAAGIKVATSRDDVIWIDAPSLMEDGRSQLIIWDPLTDDGDAFRLAVKLNLDIEQHRQQQQVLVFRNHIESIVEPHRLDPYLATRRAIVRAAAEIGKAL